MASVYLTTANANALSGDWWTDFARLRTSAVACTAPLHHLVASPEDADIILFSDSLSNTQADIRGHELYREYNDKVFVFSCQDRVVPIVPGVYAGAEQRWFLPLHMRSGYYIKVMEHEWIQPTPVTGQEKYLYSFCGAFDTHPSRRRLQGLGAGNGLIRDTSKDEARGFGKSAADYVEWADKYGMTIRDSVFILCPRGVAPSSYRLFEAMKAGRVPVIISDDWVPPVGPEWEQFSVRVPEGQVAGIPGMLGGFAHEAAEMGRRARLAWMQWFSAEQAFQTIVGWCDQLRKVRLQNGKPGRYQPLLQLARPHFVRHVVLAAAMQKVRAVGARRRGE